MKKIIAIILILLIGVFMLGGCGSTDVEQDSQQRENTKPEPGENQQQGGGDIPQPPALPEGWEWKNQYVLLY